MKGIEGITWEWGCEVATPSENPTMTHFRSGQYLHIKSEAGNYALRIEHGQSAHDAVLEAILASEKQIERLRRRLEHYKAFHRGETVSNPDALRV